MPFAIYTDIWQCCTEPIKNTSDRDIIEAATVQSNFLKYHGTIILTIRIITSCSHYSFMEIPSEYLCIYLYLSISVSIYLSIYVSIYTYIYIYI